MAIRTQIPPSPESSAADEATVRIGPAVDPPPPNFPTTDYPFAIWRLWPQWTGGTELISRVVRAGEWALRDHECQNLSCRIDVYALGDIESFDSAAEFAESVSKEALRQLSAVVTRLRTAELTVAATFSRDGKEIDSWLTAGVLLQVTSTQQGAVSNADAVTAKLSRTLGRGCRNGPVLKPTEDSPTANDAFEAWRKRPPFSWRRAAILGVAAAIVMQIAYWLPGSSASLEGTYFESSVGKISAVPIALGLGFNLEFLRRLFNTNYPWWNNTLARSGRRKILGFVSSKVGALVLTVTGGLLLTYFKKRFDW